MRLTNKIFLSVFLSTLWLSLLHANTPNQTNTPINSNMLYNCVDCSYNQYDNFSDQLFDSSYDPVISYEQPKKVKILIQDNNCPNCGLFEVSVREQPKRIGNNK